MKRVTTKWKVFLVLALIVGCFLRFSFVSDMEYKEDEEYNFKITQQVHHLSDLSWTGIPTGVFIKNPGMSAWVFIALAKVFGVTTPTGLATAVQGFALLGLSLLLPFIFYFLREDEDKEPWLWAFALAMVNPFLVFYQRKLWPEPFLPFFGVLILMGWWRRERWFFATLWGCMGAIIGQIHLSGFFFAGGLFLWTVLFGRRSGQKIHWLGWLGGSFLGAWPLIPWALDIMNSPPQEQVLRGGWADVLQLKYWVFWITNPTGLTLGNPLGLLRGESFWAQISDFVRYPLLGGYATYLTGIAHLLVILAVSAFLLMAGVRFWRTFRNKPAKTEAFDKTGFAIQAVFWMTGVLLTLTGVNIRRYYVLVVYPLEFLWFLRIALPPAAYGSRTLPRLLLGGLWVAQLFISANFVGYIHVNEGATQGDYGHAYHLIMKKRGQ